MKAETKEIADAVRASLKADFEEFGEIILTGMDNMEKRILSTVNERFDKVDARLSIVERKVSNIETNIVDMLVSLRDHNKRIGRLEKRMA